MRSSDVNRFMSIRQLPAAAAATAGSALRPAAPNALRVLTHSDPGASAFARRAGVAGAGAGAGVSHGWDVGPKRLAAFAAGQDHLETAADVALLAPSLSALSGLLAASQPGLSLADALARTKRKADTRQGMRKVLVVLWDNLLYRALTRTGLKLVPTLKDAIRLATASHLAATDGRQLRGLSTATLRNATLALPAELFEPGLRPRPQAEQEDDLCVTPPAPTPCDGTSAAPWPDVTGVADPLGWGDLKVIRTTLLRYAPGEIAHVENILAGEEYQRDLRDFQRAEARNDLEQENQSELTSSLETTNKFSFEQSVDTTAKSSTDIKAGVDASYEYGKTETGLAKVSGSADFSRSTSKEENQKSATKYAKDMVASAVAKLTQRVKTYQSVTTTTEKENKTSHTIKNEGQGDHSGVYHWLDKYYLAHVANYGQRFMYEFRVPEPAAFFRFAKEARESLEGAPPSPASAGLTDFTGLTRDNYQEWLGRYRVPGAEPPPPASRDVQWQFTSGRPGGATPDERLSHHEEGIELPPGYVGTHASVMALPLPSTTKVLLGEEYFHAVGDLFYNVPRPIRSKVEKCFVSVLFDDTVDLTVTVSCELSPEVFDAWRIKTYDAIVQAYASQLADHEDRAAQRAAERANAVFGMNPEINRQTEQIELKKGCLEIITGQRFDSMDAMRDTSGGAGHGYPEFSFSEARAEGRRIQFLEHAFEWVNMTYTFAPYFYGRKAGWLDTLKLADTDPIFESFLRSGSARVVVPVRPGYENDVIAFFSFGWEGMSDPDITIDDPRYVSIVEELKEEAGIFPGMHVEPERWVVKVPTTLVYLEGSGAALPDFAEELWWRPRLRVLVTDSLGQPVPTALVTIGSLDVNGLPHYDTLGGPNGPVAGAYDFLLQEGTYSVAAADVVGGASLATSSTAVVELFQESVVAVTLWRITVDVTDANGAVTDALVTCGDAAGTSQVQLAAANAPSPSTSYELFVNAGMYRLTVQPLPTLGNPAPPPVTSIVLVTNDVSVAIAV